MFALLLIEAKIRPQKLKNYGNYCNNRIKQREISI